LVSTFPAGACGSEKELLAENVLQPGAIGQSRAMGGPAPLHAKMMQSGHGGIELARIGKAKVGTADQPMGHGN